MTSPSASVFAGFRFPREVISLAVRWYLRYGLSYRDVQELLAERGVDVDHVTVHRWVQRFTPEFVEAARTCRHVPGDRWFVDETYVKVNGRWTYLYRAVDQYGRHCCVQPSTGHETGPMTSPSPSVFAGFRFPREVISLAVRWYLRYGLSSRDVEELLAERGVTVDHVTVYRWVQRFAPEFVEAARACRHVPGDRWFVDETYVKVNGRWTYLYRAVDHFGQVIDVWLSGRRDQAAARAFFIRALATGAVPVEVTTDRAPVYPRILDELIPTALHDTEQYANNRVEADHGRLKARLRPMRGLKTFRSARIIATGHAFVQNLRRGHYDIATEAPVHHRLPAAFDELALAI